MQYLVQLASEHNIWYSAQGTGIVDPTDPATRRLLLAARARGCLAMNNECQPKGLATDPNES